MGQVSFIWVDNMTIISHIKVQFVNIDKLTFTGTYFVCNSINICKFIIFFFSDKF